MERRAGEGILERRAGFGKRGYPYCYADPSMWNEYGLTRSKRAIPASIAPS